MRIWRRILGYLFAAIGALQLLACVADSASAIAARSWPTTTGTVQSSHVQVVTSGGRTSVWPTVKYGYEVGGKSYVGTKILLTEYATYSAEAAETVSQFLVGANVQVYFRATDPNTSVLRPGLTWFSFAWFAMSCMGLLVGFILFRAKR